MTPADTIQRLLERLPPFAQLDFLQFVEAIYQARFTGPYTVHNRNGVPHQIDLGQPIRLSIVQGERPTRLTTPPGSSDATPTI